MKKHRIFPVLLASAAVVALSACSSAPTDAKSDKAAGGKGKEFTACLVSDNGGFQDKSFNQSAHEGVEKAGKELGIKTRFAQSKQESDFATNVNSMVSQNCSLIIGVGFLLNDAIEQAAEKNPNINFALIDSAITKDGKPANLKNAKSLLFDTSQSAFLAGYVAASQSKTGKVGGYVGMSLPTTDIFVDGFKEGVAQYNKDKGKDVKYLGDGQIVGDFSNQTKGKQITKNLISQGVDVIMPVAGPVGLGTLSEVKTAADSGKDVKAVWVDSDGYKSTEYGKYILTSVKKEIGNAVFDTIKNAADGKFDPSPYIGTLENKGVSIAPFHDFDSKIDPAIKERLKELTDAIKEKKQKYATKDWMANS